MTKLLGYWKKHIVMILIIIALLIAQAYCDLALPSYTADIVDIGISNGGIENYAPEKMSAETFEKICMFLSDDEKETLKGFYDLNDKQIYKRNTDSSKNIKKIEDIVGIPMVILLGEENKSQQPQQQSQQQQSQQQTQQQQQQQQSQMGGEQNASTQMTPQQIKDAMKAKMGDFSDTILSKQAVVFVKAEYKNIGMNTDKIQNSYLIKKGIIMLLYAILAMVVSIFAGLLASIVGGKVGMELRDKVYKRVMSFSNAEMDKFSTASLITRSTNDIQQVQIVTVLLLRMIMYAPILAIGGIIKVFKTDTGLDWTILLAVVIIAIVVGILMAVAMPKFKRMQTLMDKLNLVSREILTGVLVIRAFGREKQEEERFEKANKELMSTQLFTNRVMTFMMPTMMFIMNGVTVLIVWMGAKGIDKGRLQVGDMMAFITYAMLIIISFLMLTMISIMLPRAAVAANRINEVTDTVPSITDAADCERVDTELANVKGVVKFEHVSFKYPGAEEDALSDLNFIAEPGKTTAIIGSTGCGKSTLIHLLPRFYDVTEGKITIDGVDIRDMSQNKLRSFLGFVPQKGVLFSGDIESNIKFAGDMVSDEDMKSAAEIAQATEFIDSKTDGYQSEIAQGGTNVSGGQKQRLSIARAVAKKPKVFLFDDSFSALDYKTDVVLRKALNAKLSDSTVIIVAQRISTILHADQIIVLDEGKIAGIGTHQELLENCESYQEIAKSQLSEAELKGGRA